MADTLSHVSLAGIAIGLFGCPPHPHGDWRRAFRQWRWNDCAPRSTSMVTRPCLVSLSLALALCIRYNGFNVNLFNYLFGSIVWSETDVMIVDWLIVIGLLRFYKKLIFISFDEESATVGGLPVKLIHTVLLRWSLLRSPAIPIVGSFGFGSYVIPVVAALRCKKGLRQCSLLR